ncbi:hypothetical protein ACHAXR_000155, partial [Thalassiosira sp. AJA248-18]
IGGQAIKGTVFRFDCSQEGVSVSVDGTVQGVAGFDGLGSSFVDVFMDASAVSPTLVESCVENWSNSGAKVISSLLVELTDVLCAAHAASEEGMVANDGELIEQKAAELRAAESKLKPLQEYATGVTFAPKLDDLYLVGAGVRKKSIIKVYAVAMYSSAAVLNTVSSRTSSTSLQTAARTFDSSSPVTSFVLEMVYSVGAEKIAG